MGDEEKRGAASLTREAMGNRGGGSLSGSRTESPKALRDAVTLLLDIEAIKRIKHAYSPLHRYRNFAELATLFHPDVEVHFVAAPTSGNSRVGTSTSPRSNNPFTRDRSDITTDIIPRSTS